jgi:hypothetical protein
VTSVIRHSPAEHATLQASPHPPQLPGSVSSSTQVPPHPVSPAAHPPAAPPLDIPAEIEPLEAEPAPDELLAGVSALSRAPQDESMSSAAKQPVRITSKCYGPASMLTSCCFNPTQ